MYIGANNVDIRILGISNSCHYLLARCFPAGRNSASERGRSHRRALWDFWASTFWALYEGLVVTAQLPTQTTLKWGVTDRVGGGVDEAGDFLEERGA
jgi:hypothetical protein